MPFREDLIEEFEYSRPSPPYGEGDIEGTITNGSYIVSRR